MNYYIKKDGPAAWAIYEQTVRGEKSNTPGAVAEKPIKWYATLDQAAVSLFDILTAEQQPTAEIPSLIAAVNAAKAEILAALRDGQLVR